MTTTSASLDAGCPSGLEPPVKAAAGDLTAFVSRTGDQSTLQLVVTGAKCAGCLSKIEKALNGLPGIETARLNLSTGHLRVVWNGPLSANLVGSTVTDLGYGVSAYSPNQVASSASREERSLLMAMGVAGFAAANIMLLSVSVWAGYADMGEATRRVLHIISGLIALPVLVFSGRHFFASAYNVLRHGHANMDVPISLALILAYAVSVAETLRGGAHVYFDACVMLLFFLLIGRFLDARLRRRAHAAALDLAALQNHSVRRKDDLGHVEAVRAEDIRVNDKILLASGERALVDMRILSEGLTDVDESLITGESLPRTLSAGAIMHAGTINLGQPLEGEAIGEAANSLLSELADMLEAGEQKRTRYRRLADRAVSLYVPLVHSVAALTFLGWLLAGAGASQAIMVAVTTLIITCPCALALAAPVAQIVATGSLFRQGVYLRSGDALERLAEIDHVILDKTGTLTFGDPVLVSSHGDELAIAAKLARASRHPLSRSIVSAAGPGPVCPEVREFAGLGLEGEIDGQTYRLGSADWVGLDEAGEHRDLALWLSDGESPPVRFSFEDQLRADSHEVVQRLQMRGLGVEILSGDRLSVVESTARALGITTYAAGLSPQDKVERMEQLRAEGKHVLMVGDGLNDAGALSLAHASLAPGNAMDVSQSASDGVFSGGLSAVDTILDVAIRTRRTMLQNFSLAAGYNMIAVPIAVLGFVTPLIAAVAMSASSLIVTLNALRLNTKAADQ